MAVAKYIKTILASKFGGPVEQYSVTGEDNKTLARAYLGTNQGIADGATDKISLDTESWDIGSNFNTTLYRYVAPVTGYYHVVFGAHFSNPATVILNARGLVKKDGTEIIRGASRSIVTGNTEELNSKGSDVVYMAAGSYLELFGSVNSSDSSTITVAANSIYTYLSVHLIST